jgi:hypothetical protein
MTSQESHMFNPFDGATFLTGTLFMSAFGIISGNSPVLATFVGAFVTGLFVLLAKVVELAWKHRTDKRIAELEKQLNGKQTHSLT